ncbi:class I SAM-dependent methyltransferase [Halorientalis pallida]|uniref:Class I SAM-dependent methyltransferase n=1 Tax=Halorientalis pallida TaxID=2479928 RepID=A0A498KYD1_9EURY|nr:class I SAM-dependent methyltransferase [Halorientalis pallida]RXK50349.1 class I SAM-dependent methyltransferase [Halorientalis pallida]
MPSWDERFRAGEYPQDPEPDPLLERAVDAFPEGRALDVATGTGRNAVFLADEGYRVDALDQSRAGLEITRENARERGVADRLELVQTDVASHAFPESRYAVVTVSFYRALDRLADIEAALEPGGYLFVQHHLRTTDAVDRGPSTERYRFAANELLRACLDLTVVHYDERTERRDGRRGATARVLARNSTGQRQSYPEIPSP